MNKFADWPENLPREDLVRLLRGYANVSRKVEQIIAAAFPDEFPLGDGAIVPADERVVVDHDAVAMAEKAVAEIESLKQTAASFEKIANLGIDILNHMAGYPTNYSGPDQVHEATA